MYTYNIHTYKELHEWYLQQTKDEINSNLLLYRITNKQLDDYVNVPEEQKYVISNKLQHIIQQHINNHDIYDKMITNSYKNIYKYMANKSIFNMFILLFTTDYFEITQAFNCIELFSILYDEYNILLYKRINNTQLLLKTESILTYLYINILIGLHKQFNKMQKDNILKIFIR